MIRGVTEKTMEKLDQFRVNYAAKPLNRFEAFQSMKNAGLNLGIGSALIQAGCLDEGDEKARCRAVLEFNTWNLLSDKEKSVALSVGDRVNWDILDCIVYMRDNVDDKGKPYIKPSRFDTIKKKYEPYRQIFNQNSRNIELANFFYEKTVLGYSHSQTALSIYGGEERGLMPISDIATLPNDSDVRMVGFVKEPHRNKTKKGNDQFKMVLSDETGDVVIRFFNRTIEAVETLTGRLPIENDHCSVFGTKKDEGLVFANRVGITTDCIFMGLKDLRDATEKRVDKGDQVMQSSGI